MENKNANSVSVKDYLVSPLIYVAARLLKRVRMSGLKHMPLSKKALLKAGVFPIRNHYYEPQFDYTGMEKDPSEERNLPGINWNREEQLSILSAFNYAGELKDIPESRTDKHEFFINNDSFGTGDAEYWYSVIRHFRPGRIIEIGSGYSTLMAIRATDKNRKDDPSYSCEHICIEPYEMPWLEETGIKIIRKKVEDVEPEFFSSLRENDILFIDSSHVIRPHGDVLFEYLELLPVLNKGVIVHVHDIFSPRNYLKEWLFDEVKFWNEQYLLEAFLTQNSMYKIIGGVNYLKHNHYDLLKKAAPFLDPSREPGSFYIQKIS